MVLTGPMRGSLKMWTTRKQNVIISYKNKSSKVNKYGITFQWKAMPTFQNVSIYITKQNGYAYFGAWGVLVG